MRDPLPVITKEGGRTRRELSIHPSSKGALHPNPPSDAHLQMGKLRLRDMKVLIQGHPGAGCCSQPLSQL